MWVSIKPGLLSVPPGSLPLLGVRHTVWPGHISTMANRRQSELNTVSIRLVDHLVDVHVLDKAAHYEKLVFRKSTSRDQTIRSSSLWLDSQRDDRPPLDVFPNEVI